MSINEKIREFALNTVGCAYVYGATGQTCTPSYRKARMEQYPSYANAIKNNCPAIKSGSGSCTGCKYKGRKAYDCAQLSRYAAKAGGLTLPSGASSQWKRGDWAVTGTIDTLPKGSVCFVYLEREGSNPMGHVGVYMGDGTVVDARGHASGAVHRALSDVGWTHWGMLNGQEIDASMPAETTAQMYTVTGSRLALRSDMSTSSAVLLRMDTGTIVTGEAAGAKWCRVSYAGKTGYAMAKHLRAVAAEKTEDPTPTEPEAELTDADRLDILWAWYQKEVDG